MRIQAINTNTSFKGLFTDKSKENGGEWKMEYQPYSWEKNKDNEIGRMANKEYIDIYASKLPDNDEIFTRNTYYRKESSKDILGTESYYLNYDGTMRTPIDEKPAMNREDSLKVLHKKYDVFTDMKKQEKNRLEGKLDVLKANIKDSSDLYNQAAGRQVEGYEYGQALFQRSEGLRMMYNAKQDMDSHKSALKNNSDYLYETAKQYAKLTDSIIGSYENKDKIAKELNQLKELRESGKLIDISSRTAVRPNAPLVAALQNIRAAAEKFICLPHKIMSMGEIIKQVNPRAIEGGYNEQIVRYVENIIRKGV